jgi:L-fucose mutarotase/ribose pyranase (RbsD/FucU family)
MGHLQALTHNDAGCRISKLRCQNSCIGAIRRMEVVGAPLEWPAVQREVQAEIERALGSQPPMAGLERFAYYEAAKASFAVVQVGDTRPYGCFLLRKESSRRRRAKC